MGKSNFHERKEARIERYQELANKAEQASKEAYESSNKAVEGIPPDQPILVGHHSEARHRKTLKKSWDKMGQSVKLNKKAEYYKEKAQAADQNTAISSDDPDAIAKLREKLEYLVNKQNIMKSVNKICRDKKLSETEIHEKLKTELQLSDNSINTILNPIHSYQKKGFESYQLTNNNARIKQVKQRIKKLESIEQMESKEYQYGEVRVSINVEDNRVEIYFPAKPEKSFRKKMHSIGFRWSRYKSAWQKQISKWNIEDAKRLAQDYNNL